MLILNRYSWWAGVMVGLAILLGILGQVGVLGPVQGVFLRATAPLEALLNGVFRPVATILSNFSEIDELQDENARLRVENEDLRNQLAQRQQDAQRIRELEAALGLAQGDTSQQRLAANVVHRDSSPFTSVITIDRGSNDGVVKGMVVTSTQGSLMGTVTRVTPTRSFVRLITDTRSAVRATVLGAEGADGILRGNPGRTLTLDLAQGAIQVGDTLVTAGLGGSFPYGIPIGIVSAVEGSAQDLFPKVRVEPLTRLETATTVLVLLSFVPEALDTEAP
ncbi:rod shape-determining protein MreC [Tepidiforma sp.]|uniref:rod shape-determining protein MreC n=1 Tax=Tepidiforma sp. TaxID=2682230 RepID=UPI002ADD45ED|nr:rod shape-determining protein MreC [Tepidiforma sp.]